MVNFSITVREIEDGYLVELSNVNTGERVERFCNTKQQLAQRIEDYMRKAVRL